MYAENACAWYVHSCKFPCQYIHICKVEPKSVDILKYL